MLERLIAIFSGREAAENLPPLDADLALGALLVRTARADDKYLFEEISQIDRILARRNDLNPVEAARLRADCEKLEKATPDTPEFAAKIRETVPYEDRRTVVAAMWQVVVADGITHSHEEELVHLVEDLLGVEALHSNEARDAARAIP